MSTPFADPANPVSIDFNDIHGALLLIEVVGHEDDVVTSLSVPGVKNPAIRANVTVLDGPRGGFVYEDALIFPKALQGQLRARIGKLVLGRLGQGDKQPGKNAPWRLETATDADRQTAQRWVNQPAAERVTPAQGGSAAPPAPSSQAPLSGWPGQQPAAEPPF